MANSDVPRAQTLGKRKQMETEEDQREEMEIEKLQSELNEIARRITDYRKTVPDLLTKALRSNLAAQRPIDLPRQEVTASSTEVHLTEEGSVPEVDEKIKEKLQIFREKSEKNIAAMPEKLKRLKVCIEKIDKIRQINVNVHPVLKMKL